MKASALLSWFFNAVLALIGLMGAFRYRQLGTGLRWAWYWAWVGLLTKAIQETFGTTIGTQVITHFYYPISVVFATQALAPYQPRRRGADAVRLSAIGYIIAWAILTATVEQLTSYSRWTAPLRAVLLAVIAARTIGDRLRVRFVERLRDEGVLVALTFVALYGISGIVAPFAAIYEQDAPAVVEHLFVIRNLLALGTLFPLVRAFLLVPEAERAA